MRAALLICLMLLSACRAGQRGDDNAEPDDAGDAATSANGVADTDSASPIAASGRWNLQSSGEGTALALLDASGGTVLRLFCAPGANQLLVNVPTFQPIGSEERLSFGGGGDAVALVADSGGDRRRGGVSGSGQPPTNLVDLLSGRVSASYGAQTSGPHPAPQRAQARALAEACGERSPDAKAGSQPKPAHPCNSQGNKPLPPIRLKAVGTEPFWGARIEGRCVTYSHPENQKGTRVWTKFSGSGERGSWTGSLDGRPFVLRTRPQPGCSDGMSDRRYPLAVTLTVAGEQRQGCADRL